jgi:hypothetical protein
MVMKEPQLKTFTILALKPNTEKWLDLGVQMNSLREVKLKLKGYQRINPDMKLKISEV